MAYTPTVYTNDASSPDLNATNLNKSENGIKDAHLIAVPVDCTSRVAEYTGDGIPLIPDNVAGRTYYKDKDFTVTTGWTAGSGGALTAESSMLKVVPATPGQHNIYTTNASYQNKSISVIVKSSIPLTNIYTVTGSAVVTPMSVQNLGGNRYLATIYWSRTGSDVFNIWPDYNLTTSPTWYLETIYIGTGAYNTPALDRAGNGNNLTLNAVTPVNGKYCKEMSFNGSASYAQASSPVIGTTGTVAVRFKRGGGLGALQFLYDNRDAAIRNGISLVLDDSNNTLFIARDNTNVAPYNLGTAISDTTSYHTIIISWNGSTIASYIDNVASSRSQTAALSSLVTPLTIGRLDTVYFNGIISHFRYDSRIWTADEARAWSLNPISIDSRV